MKAAVCYEVGKPLVVEEVKLDPPQQGEVKVKLAATAVCHSDIHLFKGEIPGKLPFVGGHESAGYVEEVGPGVTSLKRGDPVVISLLVSCGKCRYCLTGRSHMCNASWPLDTETRMHNTKGQALNQVLRTGSFAEYTVVDQSQLVKVSADMPLDRAALLACGVITGFGAVVNRARVEPMSSCVIIGIGGVGLNSVQGAAISGAFPIIAMDISDNKLKAARDFGATHTVNSAKEDAAKAVRDLTGGAGADYVFVTVGSAAAVQQGFSLTGPRGMTVIVGLPRFTDTVNFSPFMFIKDERVLTGSFMGTTQLHTQIPRLVGLYKAGILKLDELITHRYPLEKINEAIAEVERGEVLRNVIMFG
ncbi:MAG: zinc-binding dehydrogenase [Chloroflexi bacterium RBG_16_56_11]|nr:MAG: zinc-binding dehydrogenase [Chloroflexi bacterium RBG_16_56_11]